MCMLLLVAVLGFSGTRFFVAILHQRKRTVATNCERQRLEAGSQPSEDFYCRRDTGTALILRRGDEIRNGITWMTGIGTPLWVTRSLASTGSRLVSVSP